MYCIVLSIMLFSYEEWIWWGNLKNLQVCGYQVPPSVETGCWPWIPTKLEINRSAKSIFLSLEILIPRISLLSSSIATQSHINSEPIFINVSSMMMINSSNFLFPSFQISFWVYSFLYPIPDWLIHMISLFIKQDDSLLDVFLNQRPEK